MSEWIHTVTRWPQRCGEGSAGFGEKELLERWVGQGLPAWLNGMSRHITETE